MAGISTLAIKIYENLYAILSIYGIMNYIIYRLWEATLMSEQQIVIFRLNGQLFGAEASQVFQIIKYQEVSKMPGMPNFMEGVFNYRGIVLPIISLNKRFELGDNEISKKTKVIVSKIQDKYAGFIVNDVTEIKNFAEEDIAPAPVIGGQTVSFLKKVAKNGNQLISIIDLEKVLEDSEIKSLDFAKH